MSFCRVLYIVSNATDLDPVWWKPLFVCQKRNQTRCPIEHGKANKKDGTRSRAIPRRFALLERFWYLPVSLTFSQVTLFPHFFPSRVTVRIGNLARRRAVGPMRPNLARNIFHLISRIYNTLFLYSVNFKYTSQAFLGFSLLISLLKVVNCINKLIFVLKIYLNLWESVLNGI